MATITIPGLIAGQTTSADTVASDFYDAANATGSFEVINGNLDLTNYPTGDFTREMIQTGALSGSGGTSGTANLDYFRSLFESPPKTVSGEVSLGPRQDYVADNKDRYMVIPGGAQSFYLPYEADVIFTWTAMWGNDAGLDNDASFLRLFVDGEHVNEQVRLAPRSHYVVAPFTVKNAFTLQRARYWSGHHAIAGMDPGHHNVSLRVFGANTATGGPKQTRVWARSMRYFYFMQPG